MSHPVTLAKQALADHDARYDEYGRTEDGGRRWIEDRNKLMARLYEARGFPPRVS